MENDKLSLFVIACAWFKLLFGHLKFILILYLFGWQVLLSFIELLNKFCFFDIWNYIANKNICWFFCLKRAKLGCKFGKISMHMSLQCVEFNFSIDDASF